MSQLEEWSSEAMPSGASASPDGDASLREAPPTRTPTAMTKQILS
ncbi:hypothetical protein [Nostoc sp.]